MAGVSTLCLAVLLMTGVAALEFDMLYQTKCIMEEMDENVIVLGEYATMRGAARTPVPVDVKVRNRNSTLTVSKSMSHPALYACGGAPLIRPTTPSSQGVAAGQ